ncbi:hypothetical protein MF408_16695 [Nocardioides sp. TF02-7]|nr:hypothetical protein [Nocardioides sp. TF02-7]UMG91701.1 hypothetical protein MF408_16695 [Nocardioides sp. TF02-7]
MTSTVVRRLLAAAASLALTGATVVLAAAPASADTPEGWPDKPSIDVVEMLLLFVGVPLLVFVVVSALVLAPALARGESIGPGQKEPEPEWLGGPRKSPDELAAPDSETSKAGGAGGGW